jgi:hypothetical protein
VTTSGKRRVSMLYAGSVLLAIALGICLGLMILCPVIVLVWK